MIAEHHPTQKALLPNSLYYQVNFGDLTIELPLLYLNVGRLMYEGARRIRISHMPVCMSLSSAEVSKNCSICVARGLGIFLVDARVDVPAILSLTAIVLCCYH